MITKTMGIVVALGVLNLLTHAAQLPNVVLHVACPDDSRFAAHRARFYDVAAQQLATQWACVRSEEPIPVDTNRVAGIVATNRAEGLVLLRAESLVFSDASTSAFVMRGASSSRLYTLKGSYVVFDQAGKRLAEGPLRATQMSFALTGLDVVSEDFLCQIFGQAVREFARGPAKKTLPFTRVDAPRAVQAAAPHALGQGVSLHHVEQAPVADVTVLATNLPPVQAAQEVVTNRPVVKPALAVVTTNSAAAAVLVVQNSLLERRFSDVPNVTPADLPQPVVNVEPVRMTIACTPCNPSEQAIFLPDVRLVDQQRMRTLRQKLPVQVACAVEVDGEIVGVAPIEVALQPGQHHVRFAHDGFEPFDSTFIVKEPGHLVFPLRMNEQGFKRWTLSMRVFESIEAESVLQEADVQMVQREVRRLHGSGIRLDTSRMQDEIARTSLYRLGTQK